MTFEEWLEKEFPAHSEYDFDSKGAYDNWKRNLKLAWDSGYEKGFDEGWRDCSITNNLL